MYVVLVDYTAPQEEIDFALADHVAWLERQYRDGYFLLSGRRRQHAGGVIVIRAMSSAKLAAVLATDPLVLRKLARHEVIDFQATRTIPTLVEFNEAR